MRFNTLFFYSITLSIFIACTNQTADQNIEMSAENPFNVDINEPIAYAEVNAKHLEEYVRFTMDHAVKELNALKGSNDINFDNTFGKYDAILNKISKAKRNASNLFLVSPDSLLRAKGNQSDLSLDSLMKDIRSDKELFDKLQSFATSENGKALQGLKKRLMDAVINNFKRSGVALSALDLEHYKTLSTEIKQLSSQFTSNMNAVNEVLVISEEQANGLPDNFKYQYKRENGDYEIPVNNSTRDPVSENAESSAVRKAYLSKFLNRGADGNLLILDDLIGKRHQLGQLMGYDSYAAYELKKNMAKTPDQVWKFLNALAEASKDKALKEVAELKMVRNSEQNTPNDDSPINPWDIAYFQNLLLKTKYGVDTEKMRDYFPMESCLNGMFDLYQRLLGLTFKKIENASVWADGVELYEVYEGDTLRGRFYLDLFPRPHKETWFYGLRFSKGHQTNKGYDIPNALLLGNFTKPTTKLPSLLSFSELSILFHEFGHIMTSMAYQGPYFTLADSEEDFGEATSQIFENWLEDYTVLSAFAKHYETGAILPKTLYDNKQRAKNALSGLSLQRGLRFAFYDLSIYDRYNPVKPLNTDQLWQDIDANMGVIDRYMEGTHRQASWIHINTYPVYTYSYIWSRVYAQDMFTEFEKNGLLDTETGMRYRKLILANGTQRDIHKALEAFLGRPSNNMAYIESLGLD
ncbi:M3 family metallopeptidase [Aestuariivivens sediminicola]|uniref:M3 family metallopeptidase n=1 Tax=Aestuariivivens sediminicola TaxID=2913560 RepID=UPI001F57EB40|nr:M3 family metallopeptidase [Aestuariivivens sediminicola]